MIEAGLRRAPIYVNADGVRIAQVLTNLLANAVNFTPARGQGDRDGVVVRDRRRGRALA